jgi:hypothetical protein
MPTRQPVGFLKNPCRPGGYQPIFDRIDPNSEQI